MMMMTEQGDHYNTRHARKKFRRRQKTCILYILYSNQQVTNIHHSCPPTSQLPD
jgi:hypothetical protein